jgi:uncharacterized protein YdeI (YjbR/CyaY-like superfamily)
MAATRPNPAVAPYFDIGCGRCKLVATPACKVKRFPEELQELRQMLLESGMTEELKWSMPCYTVNGKNVLILGAFKEYCSLNFFNGHLLNDPKNLLVKAGEHSQAGRQLRFRNQQELELLRADALDFIRQAMETELSGKPVPKIQAPAISWPEELEDALNGNPALDRAFRALTPGRQRSYLLHLSSAKQASTRKARMERCIPGIMAGKGFNEF